MIDFINAAYLATASILAFASMGKSSQLWLVLSLGILVLGISRITHAGTSIDDHLERVLRWAVLYDHRRPLQLVCIAAFAFGLLIVASPLRRISTSPQLVFVMGMFYILVILMAVRASSLHWSDAFLEQQVGSITFSHAAQILLLTTIAGGALCDLLPLPAWRQNRLDAN